MKKIIHAADLFCGAGGTSTGLALAAYQGVDVWQTRLMLLAGAEEINPLVAWAVRPGGGVLRLAAIKVFLVAVLAFGVWRCSRGGD